MIARAVLVLALAGPVAALAQSPQACPWLNAGTAAKVLGAEVAVTAHADSNWSGFCRFATANSPARSIEIVVGKTLNHACASGAAPLTGIGNQASLCAAHKADGQLVQTVSGRVRDAWFVVTMMIPAPPMRDETSDSSAVEFLAGQIAGNLY